MTAREKAEALRQQAIEELLAERQAIDEMLKTLGHETANAPTTTKRRGRPPKAAGTGSDSTQQPSQPVTSPIASP